MDSERKESCGQIARQMKPNNINEIIDSARKITLALIFEEINMALSDIELFESRVLNDKDFECDPDYLRGFKNGVREIERRIIVLSKKMS